jgi:hypothetical protein
LQLDLLILYQGARTAINCPDSGGNLVKLPAIKILFGSGHLNQPLDGVRVLDLSPVAMGPFATQLLGDLDADIVKVESPDR